MIFFRLGFADPSGPCDECLVVTRGLRACWTECDLKAGSALHAVRVTDVAMVDSDDDSAWLVEVGVCGGRWGGERCRTVRSHFISAWGVEIV